MEIHDHKVGLFFHPCRSVCVISKNVERKVVSENRHKCCHSGLVFQCVHTSALLRHGTRRTHTMDR